MLLLVNPNSPLSALPCLQDYAAAMTKGLEAIGELMGFCRLPCASPVASLLQFHTHMEVHRSPCQKEGSPPGWHFFLRGLVLLASP